MSADLNNFSLNRGKSGKINLEALKGGLKREQIKDKNLLAIFDALDNGNKVLDEKEISNLTKLLKKYAKNSNLSKKEANKLLQNIFGDKEDVKVSNEDLFNFLNGVSLNSSYIKKSEVIIENGQEVVQTEYKDGTFEKLNPEANKRVIIKNNTTYTLDNDNNVLTEEYFDQNNNAVKVSYKDNKPSKKVTDYKDNSGQEIIFYDEEGKPEVKTVQKGSTTNVYEYTENGERVVKKVENGQTQDDTVVKEYEYNEDDTVIETTTQGSSVTETVSKNNQVQSQKITTVEGDNTVEKFVDENGNVTENTLNKDGKKVKQVKTVDGQTYSVEYDGNGNTYVVVQNGESIEMLSKHFGVDPEKVKELNSDKTKSNGSRKYFLVGEEVLIPKELEADDDALKGRVSAKDAQDAYSEIIRKKEEEVRRQQKEEQKLQDEVNSRKPINFTSGQKTFEDLARQLYKQEGVKTPSAKQVQLRIEELKKYNPNIKDGELQGKKVKAGVPQSTYDRVVGKQKEVERINRNIKINKEAKNIAENLYKQCDDNAAAINKISFWKELKRVTPENVVQLLDNYDNVIQKHKGDSSLVDTICSEIGASSSKRQEALNYIFSNLESAAKNAGVSDAEITKARNSFKTSMEEEFSSIGRINPSNMEKAIDFLRGATVNAKLSEDTPEITTQEAMDKFLTGSEVQDEQGNVSKNGGLVDFDAEAQKAYKDAREAEGWIAKSGDWVCGLFGCTTIDDMDKKLGQHADAVKALVEAAESKDEEKFKSIYKEVFGIDFNPKAIAARQTAQENLEAATVYDSSYKVFTELEQKAKNMDYSSLRHEFQDTFGYEEEDMDELINAYAESKGIEVLSDEDRKLVLDTFIKDTKQIYLQEYHKLSEGKSLEQMSKDVELLTKSAYGTNDIVKDVLKFNENQQMTDMVGTAALEIAGTIALQFVPVLGQLAAARLAVSAAKLGSKGIKIANLAKKTYNAASMVSKAQNATTKAKITTQMLSAGVSTATVNLSDRKSVEDTLRKTLMNMSFAGVGSTSSILAPKLMQSFGIVDSTIANELAEEIINVAGSYGVTKLSGSDYGAADGFIDIASGLIISRLSHIKTNKPNVPVPDPHNPVNTPNPPGKVGDGDAPIVAPHKPVDEGGATSGKVDIEPEKPDVTTKVNNPTPENPQRMTFLGEEVSVVKMETNKQGQKVFTTDDGCKITLDSNDNPILVKEPSGHTCTLKYDDPNSKEFSSAIVKDKKGQLISEISKKDDIKIEKNYEDGMEYFIDEDNTISQSRYLKLSEYPVGAKIPEPDVYSKNMKKQIEECNSIDKLNDLKYEYSMYNSQYGKTEDLFKMFNEKKLNLKGNSSQVITPHKPKSKLVTSTAFDEALKNFNLKKYGKKGIPLKYSHDSFTKDLANALDKLPQAEKQNVMNNLNIKFINEGGKLELSDIPNLSAKPMTQAEQDILDILNKYAKQNEIQIPDPALKAELENFIKDVPEFSFMIGKPQNNLHSYSLDSHTLQNLQKALKYADEANLADDSKEILKMSILLHDMGKQFKGSHTSDTGHAALSKIYAAKILERFDYPKSTKDKILNLIENHHWFKEFNKGNISADDVIKMFGDDLPLAKVMAKADLESVSDNFHLTILEPGKTLNQAEFEAKFNEKMNSINPAATPNFLGKELPIGTLTTYEAYILDFSKADKLQLGNNVELDLNDPQFKQLIADLKEGDSFAVGCVNPKTSYSDVKYQIGTYEEGVGSHHLIVSKKHGEIVIEPHKQVSVIKSIPTIKTANPVIAKKIEVLRNKATSITTQTFNIDGKQVPFEILNGTQGGSNKGYYVINKLTGDLYYAKFGGSQGKTELLANKLYKMAGLDVPEFTPFNDQSGTFGTLSKYIPDLQSVTSPTAKASEGFGMDALLANWDVVGLANDNLLKTPDGKIIRLDAGGTFFYRAQGANKPYTAIPTEVTTLLNPAINSKSAQIFGSMTRDEMINSLNKAVNIKDSEITKLLEDMGLTQYKEALLKRKKFLKFMLDEMKNTPQGSDSTLSYMNKINNKALNKFVENAKSLDDLEDVKAALFYIKDSNVKNNLINKIKAREKYLQAIAPKVQSLSTVQVQNLVAKNGFTLDSYGSYSKKLDQATKDKMFQQYGSYASTLISKIETPLNSNDLECLKLMLNVGNGKYISMWQKDMNALVQLYQNIKESGVFTNLSQMPPAKWDAIFNIAKAQPITAAQLDAIIDYKGCGYMSINGALTNKKKMGVKLSNSMQSAVDDIQSYINTQVLKEPITVYRGEGPEVLESVKLANGKTLAQAMEDAKSAYLKSNPKDETLIKNLINDVLNNNYVATQERFMSTSLLKGHGFSGTINWELNVPKGSKGVFLEGINVHGSCQTECELLLQKDSKITITDIDYDYSSDQWKLKGSVMN